MRLFLSESESLMLLRKPCTALSATNEDDDSCLKLLLDIVGELFVISTDCCDDCFKMFVNSSLLNDSFLLLLNWRRFLVNVGSVELDREDDVGGMWDVDADLLVTITVDDDDSNGCLLLLAYDDAEADFNESLWSF